MDKKEIEVNISTVLSNNRQAASYAGAMLGKAYTVVEARDCWQGGSEGFENDKSQDLIRLRKYLNGENVVLGP